MGLAYAYAADEDNVGLVLNKIKPEDVLDLCAVDLFWPGPVELIEGFDCGETGEAYASLCGAVGFKGGLSLDQLFKVIEMRPMFEGCLS